MFKTVKKTLTVRTVDFDGTIWFNFVRPPFDARARDGIGSTGYLDTEKEIQTLRKSFSDPEIEDLYRRLWRAYQESDRRFVRNFELSKPIKVSVTVERSEYGW